MRVSAYRVLMTRARGLVHVPIDEGGNDLLEGGYAHLAGAGMREL